MTHFEEITHKHHKAAGELKHDDIEKIQKVLKATAKEPIRQRIPQCFMHLLPEVKRLIETKTLDDVF